MAIKRVLIYRLGSLGDTIVALPSFRLIARQFPDAERRVLTVFPVNTEKESPLATILEGTGLVDSYERYTLGTRDPRVLFELYSRISGWNPDLLINITESRGLFSTMRDWIFFRLCGIKKMHGFPFRRLQRAVRFDPETGLYQSEMERLLERLKMFGSIDLDDRASLDLDLADEEKHKANVLLAPIRDMPVIAIGMGAKVSSKDWGEGNWELLLERLSEHYSGHGLMLIGSRDEADPCERASKSWEGRRVNLCGNLSPRESAAALRRAEIFVGHDGGPMHLAASVGVPCVAVFSARDLPGRWFPYGDQNMIIYHQTDCFDCRLEVCERQRKKCILSITVDDVLEKIESILETGGELVAVDTSEVNTH
jgi:ADP-heptose:LPS heptosyltransferase